MPPCDKIKRSERLKINASPAEKEQLMQKATAAGRSLSDYLRHVGLGARAEASAVQVMQLVRLLEEVLTLLEPIAQHQDTKRSDGLVVMVQLQRIEQLLVLLAPVPFVARTSAC